MTNILQITGFSNPLSESTIHFDNGIYCEQQTKTNYNEAVDLDMAQKLEALDNAFFNTDYRKQMYNVKQIRFRTIVNTIGTITFRRRQYQSKITGAYFYYVDELLDIMKHKRLSKGLLNEILQRVTVDSYQRVADDLGISKTTVYNLVKSLDGKILISPLPKKKVIKNVYIQADECYVKLQKKKSGMKRNLFMLEQITVHEGIKKVSKNRNKLINRRLYTRASHETNEDFYTRVKDDLYEMYEYENLYFYGDGALWIKNAADYIGGVYILDLFHALQAVMRLTTHEEWRVQLKNAIEENNIEIFKIFKETYLIPSDPSKFRITQFDYIMNNWESIQNNYRVVNSVGCSQEGINSHYYASRFTSRPKGFREDSARTIAQLINIKNNSVNFRLLIKKQILTLKRNDDVKINVSTNKYLPPQGSLTSSNRANFNMNRFSHPRE